MKNLEMKELIESLQKTVAAQAETIKALLLMVGQLQHPITLAPIPAQPLINSTPWPPYTPYIGDPPFGPNSPNWVTSPTNIGIAIGSGSCKSYNALEG